MAILLFIVKLVKVHTKTTETAILILYEHWTMYRSWVGFFLLYGLPQGTNCLCFFFLFFFFFPSFFCVKKQKRKNFAISRKFPFELCIYLSTWTVISSVGSVVLHRSLWLYMISFKHFLCLCPIDKVYGDRFLCQNCSTSFLNWF